MADLLKRENQVRKTNLRELRVRGGEAGRDECAIRIAKMNRRYDGYVQSVWGRRTQEEPCERSQNFNLNWKLNHAVRISPAKDVRLCS
jgi:hypothetical protein